MTTTNNKPTFPHARKLIRLRNVHTDEVHEFTLELEQHPTHVWVEHIAREHYGLQRGEWAMTVKSLIRGVVGSSLELIPLVKRLQAAGIAPIPPKETS